MRIRTPIALVLTAAWLALVVWWSFYRPCGAWQVPPLAPNEWGDWAAGAFAPLAFGWLIVGYLQQGEELRDNVRALHLQEQALQLQVHELKDSVEQQTAMARASARQAELLGKSHALALRAQLLPHQPLPSSFRLVRDGTSGKDVMSIANKGASATSVHGSLTAVGTAENLPTPLGDWHGNSGNVFLPVDLSRVELPFRAALVLRYTDELSIEQSQTFVVALLKNGSGTTVVSASRTRMSFNLPE